jgi:hypothetical protein
VRKSIPTVCSLTNGFLAKKISAVAAIIFFVSVLMFFGQVGKYFLRCNWVGLVPHSNQEPLFKAFYFLPKKSLIALVTNIANTNLISDRVTYCQ